jgi:hypothetical protein
MRQVTKRKEWILLPMLILGFIAISSTCSNQAPTVLITATPSAIFFGQTSRIVALATDDEGDPLTYVWTCSGGTFTEGTGTPNVTWQAPNTEGTYTITVTVSDGENTVTASAAITVTEPPYDFFDQFSQGEDNWTFGGCTHSIVGGELELVSTEYYQAYAESFTFSPYLDIPWMYSGDLTILSASSVETDNGISVNLNDTGTFALEHMWFAIRLNSTSRNWIWLWWIPSLASQWLPWDTYCYGTSSDVYTDDRKNTLEMSVDSNEKFTLKANDQTLSADNDAINEMEGLAGINITLAAKHLTIRGGTGTTIRWDNIIFDSETSDLVKARGIKPAAPPSDEYVNGLFDRIAQGEDVTLKSLLKDKLD